MDNKMDNLLKKKNKEKNKKREKDQILIKNKNKNKNILDHNKNRTLNDYDLIKNTYGSYYCSNCDFDTKNLKDYKRHLNTKKHFFLTPIITPKNITVKVSVFICDCGNRYKYASGLSKHRLKCKNDQNRKKNQKIKKKSKKNSKNDDFVDKNVTGKCKNDQNRKNNSCTEKTGLKVTTEFQHTEDCVTNGNKNTNIDETEIVNIMKQTLNQTKTINKLLEQNSVLIEKLSEKPTNNITYQNCGNKKMTINVFLNEKCKDAMNLTDFVNNMNISLEDLMYTKNYGYNKGISNIFVKHLKDLQPNERPIHCSDKKRMQFYVRDENKWLKDEKNEKIDKSIHDLTIKQIKHLKEWEMQNPHYLQDEKLLSQWQQLVHEIMGPSDDSIREKDKESIMKTLGNTVELKDSLIIPAKD
tara:strand:+ start:1825 stop:3060 length:1236 start_codon:yes stop_codon:yes gene_type:complete